jgi:Xaa-Pro aminopeptidase
MKARPFADREYEERAARLRRALEPHRVSVLLLMGMRNWYRDHAIRYLTGYDSPLSPSFLVFPLDKGEPTLLVGDADDLERARAVSWVKEVRAVSNFAEAIASGLGGQFADCKRLGIAGGECMGFTALDVLPRDVRAAISRALPAAELIDVGGALLQTRTIRSEAELQVLREASRIADVGSRAFLSTARAGVSERDLWSEIWYAMQIAGAEDLHMSMCRGPGSFWPHPPSDAVLGAGDIVSIELSPRISGYFTQANRMCFVGVSRREAEQLSGLACEALILAKSLMKPGAKAKEVVAGVSAFVSRSPLATMDVGGVHRIGHGCGLAVDEAPFLTSGSASELRPNQTMALHPMLYLPYRHSLLMVGDYVRITESGVETLTEPQTAVPVV